MIETTYIKLEKAAEMLDTDADTLLIAASEERIFLYGLVAEWREAELLLNDYDEWEGATVIGRRSRFVGFAPLHANKAAVILSGGEATVHVFSETRPLADATVKELQEKYERTEWAAYWAFSQHGPDDIAPTVGRDDIYVKRTDILTVKAKGTAPAPIQPETFSTPKLSAVNKERNTLLCLLATALDQAGVDPSGRGVAARIAEWTDLDGTPIGEGTVKKWLDLIPDAIEARRTKEKNPN